MHLIHEYGADAVRFGIMISSPAGNDLLFDENSLEQGKYFNNKLWNALKLVKMWAERQSPSDDKISIEDDLVSTNDFALNWFESRLNEVRTEVDILMGQFRLSEALKTIYSLIWDDFCSWYLEWVKPGFEQPIDAAVYEKTVDFFEELMQMLHPFTPFITEEIYHELRVRKEGDVITIKQATASTKPNVEILQLASLLKEVITALRDVRVKNQLKPKDSIRLSIETSQQKAYQRIESILTKQVNAESISYVPSFVTASISFVVQKDKFYIETEKEIDTASQKEQLLKDLDYLKGFLLSVEKKLGNERFVQNAKQEVIEIERRKKSDAEAKIKAIEESLQSL